MADQRTGSIYDLGYRRYEGVRLGRRHAILALYLHTLRTAFGLGRKPQSKIFPIGLALLAFVPATIQLGIAAVAGDQITVFRAEDYYGYVQTILVLFVAAVAPELVGRDQRTRTLSLYFSRALERRDYTAAKFAALVTAMLGLTLGPQLVLFIGRGLTAGSFADFLRDEWGDIAPIAGSALAISAFIAAISLAIAAQSSRRVYSAITILGVFMVPWVVANILVDITDGGGAGYALLLSPMHIIRGFTLWIFDVPVDVREPMGRAALRPWLYGLTGAAVTAIGGYSLTRRMDRIQA